MIKDMSRRKVWQPDKFQINKKSNIDIPNTSSGGGGQGGGHWFIYLCRQKKH